MALNKFMHPRNPYTHKKPDFKELSAKYDHFKKHITVDKKGRCHLDFKSPESLRALSCALLMEEYGLTVEMPLDRLIPTIPLRINYILWIEDLLQDKQDDIHGIDLGCGASCVYPLIGSKKNSWNFVASEIDGTNYSYAVKNVEKNNLQDKIKVVKVEEGSLLCDVAKGESCTYDFCMCNPPFYGSNLEAWGMSGGQRENRPEPSSVSTASPVESIVPGGEVNYVKHVILDSLILKDKVRIYTTMLGKKNSLAPLKEELRRSQITNFGTTEFCQGRTMRWGLAWSFDDTVTFPKPTSKTMKSKPPLTHTLPKSNVDSVVEKVTEIMRELKLSFLGTDSSQQHHKTWEVTVMENTWAHQRRKRRAEQRSKNDSAEKLPKIQGEEDVHQALSLDDEGKYKTGTEEIDNLKTMDISSNQGNGKGISKQSKDCETSNTSALNQPENVTKPVNNSEANAPSVSDTGDGERKEILFKCKLSVKKAGDGVELEMTLLEGQNRELMHQLMQYLKNTLE